MRRQESVSSMSNHKLLGRYWELSVKSYKSIHLVRNGTTDWEVFSGYWGRITNISNIHSLANIQVKMKIIIAMDNHLYQFYSFLSILQMSAKRKRPYSPPSYLMPWMKNSMDSTLVDNSKSKVTSSIIRTESPEQRANAIW